MKKCINKPLSCCPKSLSHYITLRRPEAAKNGVEKMSYKALNEGLSQYIRYDDKDFEPVPLQRNEKLKALLKDLRKLVYY